MEPTATAVPAELRTTLALDRAAKRKLDKYGNIALVGELQCQEGSRRGGVPVLVPLIVFTLGQIRGLKVVSDTLAAAYTRKLDLLGLRDDDTTTAQLVTVFKRRLRAVILAAAARAQAVAMRRAGTRFTGRNRVARAPGQA